MLQEAGHIKNTVVLIFQHSQCLQLRQPWYKYLWELKFSFKSYSIQTTFQRKKNFWQSIQNSARKEEKKGMATVKLFGATHKHKKKLLPGPVQSLIGQIQVQRSTLVDAKNQILIIYRMESSIISRDTNVTFNMIRKVTNV